MGRRAKGLILLVLGLGLFVAAGMRISEVDETLAYYDRGTAYRHAAGPVPAPGAADIREEKPEDTGAEPAAPAPPPVPLPAPLPTGEQVVVIGPNGQFTAVLDAGPLAQWIVPEDQPLAVLINPLNTSAVRLDDPLALYPIPVGMALGGILLGLLGLIWLIVGGKPAPQARTLRHRSAKSSHQPPDPGVGNVAWRVRLSTQDELSDARAPVWPRAAGTGKVVERPTLADPGGRMLAAAVTAAVAVALALWAMGAL